MAEGLANECEISSGLTEEHRDVIRFIRRFYGDSDKCPTIFETCRECRLGRQVLKRLFPTGYMRGACKLAGMNFKEAYMGADYMEHSAKDLHAIA